MFSGKQKLRVIGAFAALATLALNVSCTGFFVNPTRDIAGDRAGKPCVGAGYVISNGGDGNLQRRQHE